MAKVSLDNAKRNKNDEFYTQYRDIEKEIGPYLDYNPNLFRDKVILLPCDDPEFSNFTKYFIDNFRNFGIKKLISTSYAKCALEYRKHFQLSFFEDNEKYNFAKDDLRGRILEITPDNIDINNIKWRYLTGNGDFRSDEIKKLRDEADMIITNPPFSLFREFIDWIFEAKKEFLTMGNVNAVAYKGVFRLFKNDKIWLGESIHSGDREFRVPNKYPLRSSGYRVDEDGNKFIRVSGVRWFTNLEHGRRHRSLSLMTMGDNIRFSKHKEIKDIGYQKYDNYDAIDVPHVDAIPDGYEGVMGVPITFLDKYNSEQFELLEVKNDCFLKNKEVFKRIFIRKRK